MPVAFGEGSIAEPDVIILVIGPTGSGETTTLYTALPRLAEDDVYLTTIEDSMERVFERINQSCWFYHAGESRPELSGGSMTLLGDDSPRRRRHHL